MAMSRRDDKIHMMTKIADVISWFGKRPHGAWKSFESSGHLSPKIGVIQQWGIGDAILAQPLLAGLRKRWPKASIELIGKPWLNDLFVDTGLCDQVHVLVPPWTQYTGKYRFWKKEWRVFLQQLRALRTHSWDLLISIRHDPRELMQLALLSARAKAAYGASGGKYWLDLNLGRPPHLSEPWHTRHDAVAAAEKITGQKTDDLPVMNADMHSTCRALGVLRKQGYRNGLILAVSNGAGNPIRKWPVSQFEQVLEDLPEYIGAVIWVLEPHEKLPTVRVPKHILLIPWQTKLSDLKGLLHAVDITLAVDGGVLHLASACGSRVVGIYGPACPRLFGPSGKCDSVVMVEPMPCRPCFDRCIHRAPICMQLLTSQMVKNQLLHALAQLKSSRPRHAKWTYQSA